MSEKTAPIGEAALTSTTDTTVSDPMTNGAEVLFRQAHPELIHGGEPASSVFVPKPSDDGMLSVDRSALTTAKASYDLYVANGFRSAAAYGVTVAEFGTHGLPCNPDPIKNVPGQKDNAAHALVDYTAFNPTQQKKIGKRVKMAALTRGVLHKP